MIIETPLASKEQLEMINNSLKLSKTQISGIKACTKEIKNENKGIIILTADTTPMDLISHIPARCEEKKIKYLFVEKKELLVNPMTCFFIKRDDNLELYETLK